MHILIRFDGSKLHIYLMQTGDTYISRICRYLIAAILGSEYCSGYIDVAGKWNTGFYCPASDDNANIFCCGTPEDKFCCTKQDQVTLDTVDIL